MTWQPAAILYPDAELVLTGLLRTAINAEDAGAEVWVGRKLPPVRPARAVQVVRDGGSVADLRDRPRLRVIVWDTTDQKVADLARLVVAIMPSLVGQGGILYTQHESGPYEIPDAAPCRYLLFEVHLRGVAL